MTVIKNILIRGIWLFGLLLLVSRVPPTLGQESAFTYQGLLKSNGTLTTGSYDMQFELFDTASIGTGTQQGPPLIQPTVNVQSGVFAVRLDFGVGVFTGDARFLEIGVRPAGSAAPYTLLGPRQQILPTPYALRSLVASTANGLSVACVNCITTGNIEDGAVTAAKVAPQQVVKSIAGLRDDVGITAGVGISISPSNNSLVIAATPVVPSNPVLTHLRLSISGITGDNADGTIEAYTYSSGVSAPSGVSGPSAGRASFTRLIIQKGLDRASASLQDALTQGDHLQSVELSVYAVDPATQAETLTYKVRLATVIVAQMNPVLSTPSSVREEVAFDYDIIEWDYFTGGIVVAKGCFNVATNIATCPPGTP